MPDLTTEEIENAGTEALMNALKIKARQALDNDKWILAATACRMLEELSLDRAIATGARNAWLGAVPLTRPPAENERALLERTVAVPLIRPAMLDDTPVQTSDDALRLRHQRPVSCLDVDCDLPFWPSMEIRDEPGRHSHIANHETRTIST